MSRQVFSVQLQWAKMLSPKVKHLAFKRTDGNAFSYIPGQFISFHFPNPEGERPLRRSYSIASLPSQGDELIELALGYVAGGLGSEALFNLQPGEQMEMSGPYGRLILRDNEQPKRYILTATSTGVTPYRAMLPQLGERLTQQADLKVIVLLGVQHQSEQLYVDDFLAFSKQHPNFDFRICYSRETLPDAKAYEYTGYVQHQFAPLAADPEQDIIYLCGNPNMIDDAYEHLKNVGFTPQQVRREKYVS